jgi:hypothetical protein
MKNILILLASIMLISCILAIETVYAGEGVVTVEEKDLTGDGNIDILITTPFYRALLEPARGANVTSFVYRGQEFAANSGSSADGLLKVLIRPQKWSASFHANPYSVSFAERSPQKVVLSCHHVGEQGELQFVELTKTFTFTADSSAVSVELELSVQVRAQAPVRTGVWLHNNIEAKGCALKFFLPANEGVKEYDAGTADSGAWNKEPARAWSAVSGGKDATGLACIADFTYLELGLDWFAKKADTGSMELGLYEIPIPHGTSWKTTVALIPFAGLEKVDGAGANIAGMIYFDDAGTAGLKLFSAVADKLVLKPLLLNPDDPEAILKEMATVEAETKADACQSIDLGVLPAQGLLACDIFSGDTRLARVERLTPAAGKTAWKMQRLTARYQPPREEYYIPELADVIPTEHIKWASPLPGGKIGAFFLVDLNQQRQIVELSHRVDLDFRRAVMEGGSVSETGYGYVPQEMRMMPERDLSALFMRELKKEAEVIVIGDDYSRKRNRSELRWDKLPVAARELILQKVEAGTGLVYVNPTGLDETATGILTGEAAAPDHYLTRWCPPKLASPSGQGEIRVGTYGKGRIVILPERSVGLIPYACAFETAPAQQTEYCYALLARAIIWAARRDQADRLNPPSIREDKSVAFSVDVSDKAVHGTWELRDSFSRVIQSGTLANNNWALNIIPACRGNYYLHQYLTREGKAIDWRVDEIPVTSPNFIDEAMIESMPQRGLPATVRLKIAAENAPALQLAVSLVSAAGTGDCYARTLHPVAAGENLLALPLPETPTIGNRLRLELFAGDKVVDVTELPLNFPDQVRARRDGFFAVLWGAPTGIVDNRSSELALSQLRGIGFDVNLATLSFYMQHDWKVGQSFCDGNFAPMLQNFGHMVLHDRKPLYRYEETKDSSLLQREPCLSGEKFQTDMSKRIELFTAKAENTGMALYQWGDEMSYTFEGARTPIDICFSPDCLRAFREWLQKRHGTLAALNAEWETDYQDWEEVRPKTFAEVKDNLCPWFEHRLFSDYLYCTATLKRNTDKILATDPGALVSESGISMNLLAYGGYDWPRKMAALTHTTPYANACILHQLSPYFPDFRYSVRWIGYNSPFVSNQYAVWDQLFHGARNVSYWCYKHLLKADLSLTPEGERMQVLLTELRGGVGDLLCSGKRRFDRIGIVYSQPSIIAAFALDNRGANTYKMYEENTLGWIEGCYDAGLQPELVPVDRIGERELKILVLPLTFSLSQENADKLAKFVADGGWLIADAMPGIMTENGKPLSIGRLDRVFGITRNAKPELKATDASLQVDAPEAGLAASTLSIRAFEMGVAADGAVARGAIREKPVTVGKLSFSRQATGGGETMLCRDSGKGKAVYLGAVLSSLQNAEKQNIISGLVAAAGLTREVEIREPGGVLAQGLRVNRLAAGKILLLGITEPVEHIPGVVPARMSLNDLREHKHLLELSLAEPRHWYDVRARKYLGEGKTMTVETVIGTGNLFAACPEKIGAVRFDQTRLVGSGGQALHFSGQITGAPSLDSFLSLKFSTGDDRRDARLSQTVPVRNGIFMFDVQLPLLPESSWQITATEIISGASAQAVAEIKP